MAFVAFGASAQTDDPVIMTIGGNPVARSEFEYSYNKNSNSTVIDRKSVAEYVELFVNYKLKVLAAEAAGIDTTAAFRKEFAQYRDMQVRPTFVNDDDIEAEARKIYRQTQQAVDAEGGLVHVSHILVGLGQQASKARQEEARQRADSIYEALRSGADFADMARRLSSDRASAARGGDLSWIRKGQTVKEFEAQAFAAKVGEATRPFLSPYGYHIIKVTEKGNFPPYDSVRADIRLFIEQRGLRERIIDANIDSIARHSSPRLTPRQVVDRRAEQLQAGDKELRGIIREYHDGLLLYDISNRMVWERAANDTKALEAYFKRNRKRYAWSSPRFKGIAFYTRDEADAKEVRKVLKKLPFDDWAEVLRRQFNDSTVRVKAVKGVFAQGDNALVDRMEFGKDTASAIPDGYAVEATFGRKIKAPQAYTDVRDLVVADVQELMERQWVADLRKRYDVKIDNDVLGTVNNHK